MTEGPFQHMRARLDSFFRDPIVVRVGERGNATDHCLTVEAARLLLGDLVAAVGEADRAAVAAHSPFFDEKQRAEYLACYGAPHPWELPSRLPNLEDVPATMHPTSTHSYSVPRNLTPCLQAGHTLRLMMRSGGESSASCQTCHP